MPEPIRDQLVAVVPHAHWCHERDRSPGFPCACQQDRENTADALLPVVQVYAAQQAAKALEDLAAELHVLRFNGDANPSTRWPAGTKREVDSFYGGIKRAYFRARARAAALDPNGDQR